MVKDLRVETYSAEETAAKKHSIKKRAAAAGGAVVLTLGLFGLSGCVEEIPTPAGGAGAWYSGGIEPTPSPYEPSPEPSPEPSYFIVGGAGAWYSSDLEDDD
jgi:hypothetical protein